MNPLKFIYHAVVISLVFAVLYLPAYLFYTQQKEYKTNVYFNTKISQEEAQLRTLNTAFAMVAQSIYDNVINQEDIVAIIKKANSSYDEQQKADLREELYKKLRPLYRNLKRQNISQLHFHLHGNISFLRFHYPEKFGDSLVGIRPSIDKVNRTQQAIYGFEGGRGFNGFRHVFPLISNKKLIGTVEISHSFNAIKEEAMRLFPAYYAFLLKKEVINAKVWEKEANNYLPTILSSRYLLDKQTLHTLTPVNFSLDELRTINDNISAETSKRLDKGQPFLLHTSVKDKDFTVSFTPVSNIESKQIAYYVAYQQDRTLKEINRDYELELLISAFVTLAFSFIAIMYYRAHKKVSHTLQTLATTDPLTQIANRNQLHLVLQTSMQTSLRYEIPLSLIHLDIDNFKRINDQLGQATGDEILIELSAFLKQHTRSSDLVARWGGQEFIIVLSKTDLHQAEELANKLRAIIAERSFVVTAHLTCSFGVAQLQKGDTEASLLKRVDTALSAAKKEGKNRVVLA
jgi:diguanylate cyclase (GGDEF)-like protein